MRSSRPIAAVVALTLSGALLTGCTKSPTSAANVDGTAISQSDLNQAVSEAKQILGGDNALSKDQVLTVLIQGTVAGDVADQRGIVITDSDRNAKLSPAALSVPAARPFVYEVADINIVAGRIGQQQLAKAIAAADVVVNPRYGAWQPQRSITVIADNGSLSQVLQQPTS